MAMIPEKPTGYNPLFRQLLFLGTLIAIAVILFRQLEFFIGAFLGALTMYVVLRRVLFRMVDKRGWRRGIAAMVLVGGMTVLLLAIGFLVFEVIAAEMPDIDTSRVAVTVQALPERINRSIGFVVITDDMFSRLSDYLSGFVSGVLNSAYSFVANVFMMMVILYFMLAYARGMERSILAYVPFKGESLCLIEHELHNMIYSNAVGIPLVMLSQGVAAGLLYWALGLHDAVFWAFVTALCGLIPMIGTVIVSVPLGLILISNGLLWQGVALMVCGLFVIANIDNLIRIVLMGKVADTPPLVVIFGVLIGIPVFGFWGIIFGPLLISMFLLLIKIYYVEYGLIDPAAVRSKPGPRHPGERVVHRVYHKVRRKAKEA